MNARIKMTKELIEELDASGISLTDVIQQKHPEVQIEHAGAEEGPSTVVMRL